MRQQHGLRLLLGVLAGLGLLLAWGWLPVFSQAPVALAHAFVIGSDPVDGSTIQNTPAVVRIFFNEDISPASRAQVFVFVPGGSPGGSEIDRSISVVPAGHPGELDTPLLSPATLPQGSYEARWTAIASQDGHATHGLIGFNVGVSATGLAGNTIVGPSTSNILPQMNLQGILATLWELVTLLALTFWIGLVAMDAIFVFGVMPSTHGAADNAIRLLRKQGRPLQWLCLCALLVGEVIDLILRSITLSQFQQSGSFDLASIGAILLQTGYGYLWLIRLGLIACALVFGWWTARVAKKPHISRRGRSMRAIRGQIKHEQRPASASPTAAAISGRYRQLRLQIEDEPVQEHEPQNEAPSANGMPTEETAAISRRHSITWLLLAGLVALTIAYSDDTVQLAQAHVTAMVLNWLDLLAQSAWLGGVACLGFVLLPLLPTIEPETHGTLLANVLRYYVPLLLIALGVLLVSGLFSIETTITSPDQLLNDPYGRTLLVELLFYTLLLIFSAYSFFYLLPTAHRQVVLLPVVNADLPARRARRSALEQSISSLKRAMHILALLGAGILLCVALMAFYAPPIVFPPLPATSTTTGASNTPAAQSVQTQTVGNVVISLQVSPARADTTNYATVTLKNTNSSPITHAHVQLRTNMQIMDMGVTTKAAQEQASTPTYTASFTPDEAFSMLGAWVISITIQQSGQSPVQAQFIVTLLE